MKTINITFEDAEFMILETRKEKSGKNWHDFIMDCCSEKTLEKKAAEWRLMTGF